MNGENQPAMSFGDREYEACCTDPRLSSLQGTPIVQCATCGEVRPPIAKINVTVNTCPFCGDAILEDVDWWDLDVYLLGYPDDVVAYTCPSCFNTFYVNCRNVPAGALAASLVPA